MRAILVFLLTISMNAFGQVPKNIQKSYDKRDYVKVIKLIGKFEGKNRKLNYDVLNLKTISLFYLLPTDTNSKEYKNSLKLVFKNTSQIKYHKASSHYIKDFDEYTLIHNLLIKTSENYFKQDKINESKYYSNLLVKIYGDTTELYKYFNSDNALPPEELIVSKIERVEILLKNVNKLIGTKYSWGNETPEKGFDCSGYIKYLFSKVDVKLIHNANIIAKLGEEITITDIKTGDLIIFGSQRRGSHIAMVIKEHGRLNITHCISKGVSIDDYSEGSHWRKSEIHRVIRVL